MMNEKEYRDALRALALHCIESARDELRGWDEDEVDEFTLPSEAERYATDVADELKDVVRELLKEV